MTVKLLTPTGQRLEPGSPDYMEWIRKQVVRERIVAPKRERCSVCRRPMSSYDLEPGSGRCKECVP